MEGARASRHIYRALDFLRWRHVEKAQMGSCFPGRLLGSALSWAPCCGSKVDKPKVECLGSKVCVCVWYPKGVSWLWIVQPTMCPFWGLPRGPGWQEKLQINLDITMSSMPCERPPSASLKVRARASSVLGGGCGFVVLVA